MSPEPDNGPATRGHNPVELFVGANPSIWMRGASTMPGTG